MRLEKIKLAGFKSFVDPTTIDFPSNLTGIVGPNGCGKSNVIDAVRWVMGESSAKTLRGESITDVIFNGTTQRKPVGQASIELIFDNKDGKIGGQYAQYSQISIKRQVNRDAQSTYFLNGTKCRRRDIVDVFLGTGLGPRSYSIIEQGMISRLIEAKPEEMRAHLEEVSGISQYKTRRRETENRIRHTKENLDRLNDLREEITKQLDKLKRQANAAERYKVLKDEERLLRARSQALRWQGLDEQAQASNQILQEHETVLQKHQADHQNVDTQITKLREAKHEIIEQYNEVQSQYYTLGADITRVEQAMQHYKERQTQLTQDLEQAQTAWNDLQAHFKEDTEQMAVITEQTEALIPTLEEAKLAVEESREALHSAEQNMHQWQTEWDEFNHQAADASKTAQVEQTRIQHIEQRQFNAKKRLDRVVEELSKIDTAAIETELLNDQEELDKAEQAKLQLEQQLDHTITEVKTKRDEQTQLRNELDKIRSDLQSSRGRFASLDELQQEALGRKETDAGAWLESAGLSNSSRLAQLLSVKDGWDKAVEIVLAGFLQAVCVDNVSSYEDTVKQLENGMVTLLDTTSNAISSPTKSYPKLSEKVQGPKTIMAMLEHIYIASSLHEAMQIRKELAIHESVVTPDGVWLSPAWMHVMKTTDVKSGVIAREQELKTTQTHIESLEADEQKTVATLEEVKSVIATLEMQRQELQQQVNETTAKHAEIKALLQAKQSQVEKLDQQRHQLESESAELREQLTHSDQELDSARSTLHTAKTDIEQSENKREALLERRDECRHQLDAARNKAREDREVAHQYELQLQNAQTQLTTLEQNISRLDEQQSSLKARCEQLQEVLSHGDSPLEEMQIQLDTSLEKRVTVEAELTKVKQSLDENEHNDRELDNERHRLDDAIQEARTSLENKRLALQEVKVRRNTLTEQLSESGFNVKEVIAEIPEDLNEQTVNQDLEKTVNRIARLGPINLAAIDEYKTQSERKEYLDAQNEDLVEALTTLENAIRKIDKETRDKFKETFDTVNGHFQAYFPKIFGGGSAYLELVGEDLLDAGVAVMARPPGKRNSTIHLLSGGEKALTAVSLVFSMFQLNPAPFCLLDEVDAPLDDANVSRFCRLVEEMSEKVQFIFISHNKVAIEMSKQLMGVTMHEPGVSRIVSVDIDEAVAMTETA